MVLRFKQFEHVIYQAPIKRSFPGKKQTVVLPNGESLTGMVEKVDISSLIPVQDPEDIWNETSRGYSKGFYNVFDGDSETLYDEGEIQHEDNLPPCVVDEKMRIIDGHHRWAALQYLGFDKINVIRIPTI